MSLLVKDNELLKKNIIKSRIKSTTILNMNLIATSLQWRIYIFIINIFFGFTNIMHFSSPCQPNITEICNKEKKIDFNNSGNAKDGSHSIFFDNISWFCFWNR